MALSPETIDTCSHAALFSGIAAHDLPVLLGCLDARQRCFERGETLLREGQATSRLGLVVTGGVTMSKEDFWGNRDIVGQAGPADTFAESYACASGSRLAVSVSATSATCVLLLDAGRLLTSCPAACSFHGRLIENLVSVIASKNLAMNEKLTHVTQRSTRDKLLSYLGAQSLKAGSSAFEVPFGRQQLADYLAVNRSAMCAELSRMRDDGLIDFHGRTFVLLGGEAGRQRVC